MYEHVLNRQVDQLKQTIHMQNEKIEAMKIENQLVLQARMSEEREFYENKFADERSRSEEEYKKEIDKMR
jgi:hypothetical protein